ncbi:DUF1217 domain-containing protein [Oceanibium sediminis]|uniref:DUF1217 domain-containing protein n=1 Tax=Oceanibium sediminis TaxID=2026339 RepID=UPI000DD42F0F|nr:DUF1217 domain-containing protein [Oceanibium sediminis]
MFQPVVPLPGVAGWRFLEATEDAQRAAFDRSPVMERDLTYFAENIAKIGSAADLVADRTLLKVALGAFGLKEELPKRAFLERILAEGSEDPKALANRFVDPRYADLARAFGFGDLLGSRTGDLGFPSRISSAYRDRQFEAAVGNASTDMRLALTLRREITALAESGSAETSSWFRILGSTPLRRVFEGVYNLPKAFAGIDLDTQRATLQDKTQQLFGSRSVAVFKDTEAVDRLINRFLVTQQAAQGPSAGTPGFAALSLLQSGGMGSAGMANLILSAAAR